MIACFFLYRKCRTGSGFSMYSFSSYIYIYIYIYIFIELVVFFIFVVLPVIFYIIENVVIEVGFRLEMMCISVAGIILWTYLLTFCCETIVFSDLFLFKFSLWIIFFAGLSPFCSSTKFHVLNWLIRRENHFFLFGGRLVYKE